MEKAPPRLNAHEFFCKEVVMNKEMRARYFAARRATSAKICESPEDYKVCWHCLSIAYKRASICPICQAHRFYESADAVRVVAGMMERVAFPVSAGTVPRFGNVAQDKPEGKEVDCGN
jgi:hypothetical protein